MRKFGLLFGVLMVAMGAQNGYGQVAACVDNTTVDAFTTCQIGDKIFSEISETLPATATLDFSVSGQVYTLRVDFEGADNSGQNFQFIYTVAVAAPSTDLITSVSIDSDVQPQVGQGGTVGGTTITKLVENATTLNDLCSLTSTNGSFQSCNITPSTAIRITENFTVAADQDVFSASNAFTQTAVPEPASMLLFGLGLAGLGFWGRKRFN